MEISNQTRIKRVDVPVVTEKAKSIDTAAATAAASKKPKANPALFGGNFNPDWLRLALAAGGGLIAHSLASSIFDNKTDEEKRRESIWQKLVSAMIPLGAAGLGAWGGYALGGNMKSAQAGKNGLVGPRIENTTVPQPQVVQQAKTAPATTASPAAPATQATQATQVAKPTPTFREIPQTKVNIGGTNYWVNTSSLPQLKKMTEGYVPGEMQSSELDYMREHGNRISKSLGKDNRDATMLGVGGSGVAALGSAGAAYQTLMALKERNALRDANKAISAQNAAEGASGAIEKRISELTADIKAQMARANKAEAIVMSGKGNVSAAQKVLDEANALSGRMRQEVAALQRVPSPAKPRPIDVDLANDAIKYIKGGKPRFGRRLKGGLWGTLGALGAGASWYGFDRRSKAIQEQEQYRAALENLANLDPDE